MNDVQIISFVNFQESQLWWKSRLKAKASADKRPLPYPEAVRHSRAPRVRSYYTVSYIMIVWYIAIWCSFYMFLLLAYKHWLMFWFSVSIVVYLLSSHTTTSCHISCYILSHSVHICTVYDRIFTYMYIYVYNVYLFIFFGGVFEICEIQFNSILRILFYSFLFYSILIFILYSIFYILHSIFYILYSIFYSIRLD